MPTMTTIAWRLLEPNSTSRNPDRPPAPDRQEPPRAAAAPPPAPPGPNDTSLAPISASSVAAGSCFNGGVEDVEVDKDKGLVVERKGEVGLLSGEFERAEGVEEDDDDVFLDSRDRLSVASNSDTEDEGSFRRFRSGSQTPLSNQSLYYDSAQDFFSDGSASVSSPSMPTKNEVELCALRLDLFEEIEKKKRAEEALLQMQNQWQRLAKFLFQVGLSLPETQYSGNMQIEVDPSALCQEIVVTRYVSEAIERGIARAETEALLEEVIETKNHEISRLRDRVQYYEAMNHEMSQRNKEAFESSQQRRLKIKRRQRWIWNGICLSITAGTALLAYSYFSDSGKSSSSSADAALSEVESVESGACAPQ